MVKSNPEGRITRLTCALSLSMVACSFVGIRSASAYSYDDIVCLVNAEQKALGRSDSASSLEERLHAVEVAVNGHGGTGSEKARLAAVCTRLGIPVFGAPATPDDREGIAAPVCGLMKSASIKNTETTSGGNFRKPTRRANVIAENTASCNRKVARRSAPVSAVPVPDAAAAQPSVSDDGGVVPPAPSSPPSAVTTEAQNASAAVAERESENVSSAVSSAELATAMASEAGAPSNNQPIIEGIAVGVALIGVSLVAVVFAAITLLGKKSDSPVTPVRRKSWKSADEMDQPEDQALEQPEEKFPKRRLRSPVLQRHAHEPETTEGLSSELYDESRSDSDFLVAAVREPLLSFRPDSQPAVSMVMSKETAFDTMVPERAEPASEPVPVPPPLPAKSATASSTSAAPREYSPPKMSSEPYAPTTELKSAGVSPTSEALASALLISLEQLATESSPSSVSWQASTSTVLSSTSSAASHLHCGAAPIALENARSTQRHAGAAESLPLEAVAARVSTSVPHPLAGADFSQHVAESVCATDSFAGQPEAAAATQLANRAGPSSSRWQVPSNTTYRGVGKTPGRGISNNAPNHSTAASSTKSASMGTTVAEVPEQIAVRPIVSPSNAKNSKACDSTKPVSLASALEKLGKIPMPKATSGDSAIVAASKQTGGSADYAPSDATTSSNCLSDLKLAEQCLTKRLDEILSPHSESSRWLGRHGYLDSFGSGKFTIEYFFRAGRLDAVVTASDGTKRIVVLKEDSASQKISTAGGVELVSLLSNGQIIEANTNKL